MAHIEWLDSFNCDIELIDEQHKNILNLINRIDDVVTSQDRDALGLAINELMAAIIEHFDFEEELMGESGYGHLKAHKKLHDRFITKLASFTQRQDAGENITEEIHPYLENWFIQHTDEDQDYCHDVAAEINKPQKKKQGWFSRTFG